MLTTYLLITIISLVCLAFSFILGLVTGYQTAETKWLKIDNARKDLINTEPAFYDEV